MSLFKEKTVAKMLVMLSEPPHGKERAYLAMRFVLCARHEGHEVDVVLFENARRLPQPEPEDEERVRDGDEKRADCQNVVTSAIALGATVKICELSRDEGALARDQLTKGVATVSMDDVVKGIVEADRAVTF